MAQSLGISEAHKHLWWKALSQSKWSDNQSLRGLFILPGSNPRKFFTDRASPMRLVASLQALVAERLLTQRQANALMERVLDWTHADPAHVVCDWRGQRRCSAWWMRHRLETQEAT